MLRSHRLAADRLMLEVAEHAATVDIDDLMSSMAALRAAGVRVALDDFGAGFSRSARCTCSPPTSLKVDIGGRRGGCRSPTWWCGSAANSAWT